MRVAAAQLAHADLAIGAQLVAGEAGLRSVAVQRQDREVQPAFDEPAAAGEIVCDLGMVPLMPGRYVISLWLGDTAIDHHIELETLFFEVTARPGRVGVNPVSGNEGVASYGEIETAFGGRLWPRSCSR